MGVGMANEYLDIPKCPKCANPHRYKLTVDRTIIIKMLTTADLSECPRHVRFTRLFTCPAKNEDFEATFVLTDTSSSRITTVSVAGIADDNAQD